MMQAKKRGVYEVFELASYTLPTLLMLILCVLVKTSMDEVAATQQETLFLVKDIQEATMQAIEQQLHERQKIEYRLLSIEAQILTIQQDEGNRKRNRKRKLQH